MKAKIISERQRDIDAMTKINVGSFTLFGPISHFTHFTQDRVNSTQGGKSRRLLDRARASEVLTWAAATS